MSRTQLPRMQNTSLTALIAAAEAHTDWWRLCYPRSYQVDNSYASVKSLATELVAIRLACDQRNKFSAPERILIDESIAAAGKLVEQRIPIFFVAPDLLKAIQMSTPALELDWASLLLPFESAAFALPRGTLTHSQHGHVGFIWYARFKKGSTFPDFADAMYYGAADDDFFFLRVSCMESSERPSFQQFIKHSQTPLLDLRDLTGVVDKTDGPQPLVGDDLSLVSTITSLLFNLFFAMAARPQLTTRGKATGKVAKSGAEFWTPNIIGKDYVLPTGTEGGHQRGSSPRMHYRRGHMRQQAYGDNHSLRRPQWIEPMLIAATTEIDSKPVEGKCL